MLGNGDPLELQHPGWVERGYAWFLYALAGYCLLAGLVYWGALTGLIGNEQMRFDAIDVDHRIFYSVFAVILPFAGFGIWHRAAWGMVVWIACALLQAFMHGVWSDEFGARPLLVAFNLACILVLVAYTLGIYVVWRRQRAS